ncbi:MAG: hypothetical protein ACI857_002882, partial [Arenicella sp.]
TLGINEFTGKQEELKRGKGSQKKAKVSVMASFDKVHLKDFNDKKHKTNRKIKYLKMKVIEDLQASTINSEVEKNIDSCSWVNTDPYKGYNNLPEIIQ